MPAMGTPPGGRVRFEGEWCRSSPPIASASSGAVSGGVALVVEERGGEQTNRIVK
jgi:hypothetical protein